MAHVFKWKAIYRIIKNQRSPEIEERGRAFSDEFAALLGSTAWCFSYLTRTSVTQTLRALTEKTVRGMIATLVQNQINFIRAWGLLISRELLDALKIVIEQKIPEAATGGGTSDVPPGPGTEVSPEEEMEPFVPLT